MHIVNNKLNDENLLNLSVSKSLTAFFCELFYKPVKELFKGFNAQILLKTFQKDRNMSIQL